MGIVDFHERLRTQYAERFRELALAQDPDTFFICCSDSRVIPHLLASSHPGDLFTMRNVGNLVPPSTADGLSTGDISEASGIEYAVLKLHVSTIVVCGHSECGAMRAVHDGVALTDAPNLDRWLHHARSATFRLAQEGPIDDSLPVHDQLSQLNVLVQLEHLMSYPLVRERVTAGKLHLSGWWFDIAKGDISVYDRATRRFELIDRQHAEQLMAR
jgi:carbonic anhydrase